VVAGATTRAHRCRRAAHNVSLNETARGSNMHSLLLQRHTVTGGVDDDTRAAARSSGRARRIKNRQTAARQGMSTEVLYVDLPPPTQRESRHWRRVRHAHAHLVRNRVVVLASALWLHSLLQVHDIALIRCVSDIVSVSWAPSCHPGTYKSAVRAHLGR